VSTTIVPDSARCASANRRSSEASVSGSVISSGISVTAIAAADVKVQQHDIKITIAIYRFSPDIRPFLLLAGCC
jgi:hypothetical protein